MADLVMALAVVALAAGLAVWTAPSDGLNVIRFLVGGLVVFLLPGYLFMEAIFPRNRHITPGRGVRIAAAIGVSPALVGLFALTTALFPAAFLPANIIFAVTLGCLALAAVAAWRRAAPVTSTTMRAPRSGPGQHVGQRGP